MRIRLSNLVACSDIVTALLVAMLVGSLSQPIWGGLILVCYLPNVLPLWLNPRGHYWLARTLSVVVTCIWIVLLAYIIGPAFHVEMALIATLSGTMVLIPLDDPHRRLFLSLPVLSFILVMVLRAWVPFPGLTDATYAPYIFAILCLATMLNVADRITMLLREAERRSTQLQEAHQTAIQASEAKSRFLAHMSHELRTPLAGVIGLTDLALETRPEGELRELLDLSHRSAHHLMELLSGVLDLAKIEAGAMQIEQTRILLPDVLQESLVLVRLRAQERGLHLISICTLPPQLWVQGDALRIKQILVNLLGNAIKFTPTGEVCLAASWETGDHLRLQITDTGIGMTPEQLDRVFQPFQQAEDDTTRRYGGTGLGLSITRQLIALMEGTLQVESHPGEGTRFTVTLPLRQALPPVEDNVPAPIALPAGLQILVAEDNAVNQLVLSRMLARLGQSVTLADDGDIVLAQCQDRTWDLILMDMQMPHRDGLSATRALREQGYTGPICGLTANALREDHDRCREAGMDEVLVKPIDLPTLADLLARRCASADGASHTISLQTAPAR